MAKTLCSHRACTHGEGNVGQFCYEETEKSNDPWDNLKVGQEVMWNENGKWQEVVEVTENLFAILEIGEGIVWCKKRGYWTIKDSTPKEEEALEVGSLYLNGKTHLWRLLLDGTFQFFDDSNKKWSKGINVLKDV